VKRIKELKDRGNEEYRSGDLKKAMKTYYDAFLLLRAYDLDLGEGMASELAKQRMGVGRRVT
jgi:hypothetical protein